MHTARKKIGQFFLALFSLCLVLSGRALAEDPPAAGPNLPDVPGWICEELRTTNLDTVSGNQGTWQQRDYRVGSGALVRATLMAGRGAKMLRFPPQGTDADDGPLGSGCTYRTAKLGGRDAIVETHPVLGASVTVKLDGGYLTLESGEYGLSAEELASAAELLCSSM